MQFVATSAYMNIRVTNAIVMQIHTFAKSKREVRAGIQVLTWIRRADFTSNQAQPPGTPHVLYMPRSMGNTLQNVP
jgi:hypothetical protein